MKKLLQVVQSNAADLEQTVFSTDELIEMAQSIGLTRNFSALIDSLNSQGFLLKKGQSLYKFLGD